MKRRITIWERDDVVAEDIVETVTIALSDADVARVASLEDAAAQLAGHPDPGAIAILHGTREELCSVTLLAAIEGARPRVIAIHSPLYCSAARSWIFLPPPFTAEALVSAVNSATAPEG